MLKHLRLHVAFLFGVLTTLTLDAQPPGAQMDCCPNNWISSGNELVLDGNFGPLSSWIQGSNTDYYTPVPWDQANLATTGASVIVNGQAFSPPSIWSCTGKSGPNDYFLACNGWVPQSGKIAWRQAVTITPGNYYTFSAWANNLVDPSHTVYVYDPDIQIQLVDYSSGTPNVLAAANKSLPLSPDQWERICLNWQAVANSNNTYVLEILNLQIGSPYGNDFALDCISFKECVLACSGNVSFQITDNSCSFLVTASMLLDGGPYNDNDYFIELFNAPIPSPPSASGQGAVSATPQVQQYRITEIATNATCEGSISVSDAKRPTPICQGGHVAAILPAGNVTVNATDLDGGSTDNCGPVTLSISPDGVNYYPSLEFFCPGIFPVNLGVTDQSGNFDFCQTLVYIQDNDGNSIPPPPLVVCNNETQVALDANCQASVDVFALLEGGPYGPGCWYFLEFFEGPGFTNPVASGYGTVVIPAGYAGQTLVYRITNTDSGHDCSGTVEVIDNTPPQIICPDNQEIPADSNCEGTIGTWSPVSVSDNCTPLANIAIVQMTPPGQTLSGHNDTQLVILQATDDSGNMDTCSFTVTLKDVTAPVIACPADQARTACSYVASGAEFDFSFVSENCLGGGFGFDWSLSGATTGNGAGTTLAGTVFNTGTTTAQWTMTDGAGNPGTCSFTVTVGSQSPDYAPLMALYNATNGPNWTNNSGWGTDCNVCNWYGVQCDGNGRVIWLYPSNNNLTGFIPPEIGDLTSLQLLDLGSNNLSGSIPPEVGNLSNLEMMFIGHNPLSGNIPPQIGNLGNLRLLYLNYTNVSGSIPLQIGNLTNLTDLGLFNNNLSGNIPAQIGNLVNLKALNLEHNQLVGNIPPEIGNLANLELLYLHNNQLSGNIPMEIGNLLKINNILLNQNQLTGPIPPGIGLLPLINFVWLNNNNLTGCFPATLSGICSKSYNFSNNPGLPGGGDFAAFCANGTGGGVVITGINITDESCPNAADGSITINAVSFGGTLLYSIDGGTTYSSNNSFSNLAPGNYSIQVTQQGITGGCDAFDAASVIAAPPSPTWYKDLDNDGYSDGLTQIACTQPAGYKLLQNLIAPPVGADVDCNDNDPVQFPGQIWYKDQDNDGYSDGTTKVQCAQPGGYQAAINLIATSGDCQDGNGIVPGTPNASYGSIYPNAPETCNGIDDDCDGSIDESLSGFIYTGNVQLNSQAAVDAWPQCYSKITGNLTISGGGTNSLANLANLTEVTGNVSIMNAALPDLTGLDGLTTVDGNLSIRQNNAGAGLSSLQGLQTLQSVGGNLMVRQNSHLTDCCPIELLILNSGVGGSITISQNNTGCDNVNEVLNGCPGFTGEGTERENSSFSPNRLVEIGAPSTMTLYPNPAVQEVNVFVSEMLSENGFLRVYNTLGVLVWQQEIEKGAQHWLLSIKKAPRNPAGLYLVTLESGALFLAERLVLIE